MDPQRNHLSSILQKQTETAGNKLNGKNIPTNQAHQKIPRPHVINMPLKIKKSSPLVNGSIIVTFVFICSTIISLFLTISLTAR